MEICIITEKEKLYPVVLSGMTWSTERMSTPGKLTFDMLSDGDINFAEGDAVTVRDGDMNVFLGYIFTIKISKDGTISVTAYDQLRYFKNKDTRIYKSLTADALLKSIASDYGLSVGDCDVTGLSITRVEEDAELFSVMENAIYDTVTATGKLYVLFDDFGELRLKDIESLRLPILIRDTSCEGFTYSSSIDDDVYNVVKLAYDNDQTGKREYYIAQDSNNIAKWGRLQKYEKIDNPTAAQTQAEQLLGLYNAPVRKLSLSGVFGDSSVRAGTSVVIPFLDGNAEKYKYMLVESAKHRWADGIHSMDLVLKGGDING